MTYYLNGIIKKNYFKIKELKIQNKKKLSSLVEVVQENQHFLI